MKIQNSLLYYIYHNFHLVGSLIDAIEYFLVIFEQNKDFKLIFINSTNDDLNKIFSIIEDRYNLTGIENYRNNILSYSKSQILRTQFDQVLTIDYSVIKETKGLICTKKIISIVEKHTENPNFMYNKKLYNVDYYGEMPFEYRDYPYRMKMLFSRYKPLKEVRDAIYINSPSNKDFSFISTLNLPNKPILKKSRTTHKNNLFEFFTLYVYYHANTWFDPHPRLFQECYFYGKDILYFNKHNIIDGSYYRYNDLLENGLKDRYLDQNDEIVRLFL